MSEQLRVAWRRKWRILAASVVVAAVIFFHAGSRPELFQATVSLRVLPAAGDTADLGDATAFLTRSYARLAESPAVVGRALQDPGLDGAESDADEVRARADGDVGFVEITTEARSARRAEQLADVVAATLVTRVAEQREAERSARLAPLEERRRDIERELVNNDLPDDSPRRPLLQAEHEQLSATAGTLLAPAGPQLEVLGPAQASRQPIAPTPARDALLALGAALLANAAIVLVLEAVSDRFSADNTAGEVSRVTGLPVLATIPRGAGAEVVEGFRSLRTALMFMSTSERLRTLAVVGVDPGSGKSFVVLNLAREASNLGVPVVVIDGDLRRPVVHDRLELARCPGLSEALAGHTSGPLVGQKVLGGELRAVTAGTPVPDPAGLFGGRAFRELLDGMAWAELVVVDTPASGLFADAMAIASQCDATILVVDAQATRRRPVRALVEGLRQVSAQPVGVVLNRTEPLGRTAYYERKGQRASDRGGRRAAQSSAMTEPPAPPPAGLPVVRE